MYSKTSLGSDQLSGGSKLSRRGKLVAFSVAGAVIAVVIGFFVWSAVGGDAYGSSANGCVNFNIANSMGGLLIHHCGADAKAFCKHSFATSDTISLLARPQCVQAGLTEAKVSAG
jgi:hypothetical protein